MKAKLVFIVIVLLLCIVTYCTGCNDEPEPPPTPLSEDVEVRFTKSSVEHSKTVSEVKQLTNDMHKAGYRIVSVFHDRNTWKYVVVGQKKP